MSNGELLHEVKQIFEEDIPIPTKVANRLVMAGQVQNYKVNQEILTILYGNDGKSGLIAKVEENEKSRKNQTRLNWLLISVLIAEFLGRLII